KKNQCLTCHKSVTIPWSYLLQGAIQKRPLEKIFATYWESTQQAAGIYIYLNRQVTTPPDMCILLQIPESSLEWDGSLFPKSDRL
ncbi:Oxysterol-binding protein-like protein OBPa, partial [Saccharomyces cerevisiae]